MPTTSQQIKQTRIYYKGLKQAAAAYTDKDQLLESLDYLINHKNTTKELLSWAKEVKDSFMLQFNVMIPMLQVFDYITKNKYVSDYISKVLEEGKEDKSSIIIPFRASEIYEAMIGFNEISANQLLYLMCKESNQVYEQLCDAFERKDENEFIRVAKENDCDFETITKVLKRIPIGSDILKFTELVDKENNEGRADIVKALKERSENPEEKETFSKLYAYLQEKDQAKKYDYLYLYWDDVRKRTPKSFVSLLLRYAKIYYYGFLSENELDVFVQILEHPLAVQFQLKYHNEIEAGMEKLLEEIEKNSNATDSTTTQKSENETNTNSQKESQPTESTTAPISTPTPEPDQETITVDPNLTDRDYETFAYPLLQGKKKGRHRGKWYDTKYYNAAEDELGDSIKRDVWPLIRKHLGEFDYPDSVAGESKRTIMKNLGAALIYYAAQGTIPPIAKDWNAQGVKSSYERTFKRIEVVARNSVDAFMTMLEKYEEVEPLLESDQKNKAALKLSVLLKNYGDEQKKYILSHNLYEIKGLIEYLRDRLPVIFKPYCKDK